MLEARQSALQNERTTVPFRSALHARKRASTLKQKRGGNHMPQTLLLIDQRGPCPRPRTEIRIRGDMHQRSRDNTDRGTARRAATLLAACPLLASCTGVQSALDPAGEEAAQVATLFWAMTIGGAIIWAGVVALSLYASRWKRGTFSEAAAGRLILWAGVVFPVTVLTALLALALWLMPSLRPFAGGEQARLRIEVTGHQFWWHVVYHRADGVSVMSANEIRLPVGERVEFSLASADMIHSFWIPALGGKMDLIPGRTNRLSLLATKPGRYRGQCAEFCGISHALMAFPAIAMEPAAFDAWLGARSERVRRHSRDTRGRGDLHARKMRRLPPCPGHAGAGA